MFTRLVLASFRANRSRCGPRSRRLASQHGTSLPHITHVAIKSSCGGKHPSVCNIHATIGWRCQARQALTRNARRVANPFDCRSLIIPRASEIKACRRYLIAWLAAQTARVASRTGARSRGRLRRLGRTRLWIARPASKRSRDATCMRCTFGVSTFTRIGANVPDASGTTPRIGMWDVETTRARLRVTRPPCEGPVSLTDVCTPLGKPRLTAVAARFARRSTARS